jgi:hypothetical protein
MLGKSNYTREEHKKRANKRACAHPLCMYTFFHQQPIPKARERDGVTVFAASASNRERALNIVAPGRTR